MKIDLDSKQKKLLLQILGIAHAVEHLKGKDNSHISELIGKMHESLKEEGNIHIFDSVFHEQKP